VASFRECAARYLQRWRQQDDELACVPFRVELAAQVRGREGERERERVSECEREIERAREGGIDGGRERESEREKARTNESAHTLWLEPQRDVETLLHIAARTPQPTD
jgi:hypothetical protein